MWVFFIKENSDGSFAGYKARFLANGIEKEVGIDCNETFSPVMTFICVVLSLTFTCKWAIHQLDVKNAFL